VHVAYISTRMQQLIYRGFQVRVCRLSNALFFKETHIDLNFLFSFVEPTGSLQECAGPLTSLHRIIPAITQGYALCDIMQGFHLLSTGLGPEFIAHGVGESK